MKLNHVNINKVSLNRVILNTVGTLSKAKGEAPPEPGITDALLMEDGSLFLMENGSYFALEKAEQSKVMPKIDKSYWNF